MTRKTLTALLAGLTLSLAFGPAPIASSQTDVPAAKPLRNGCAVLYRQAYHAGYAAQVYRRPAITSAARAKLKRLRTCARSAKAGRKMRALERRLRADRRYRIAVARITPYPGPNGTRWAVPYPIVRCEGGANGWFTFNRQGSGAAGPYQLLGWGAPMPANTPARKLAHHRIAARLWAGGRGASHWRASIHCHGIG